MNKLLIVLTGVTALTLSACSDLPGKDVPIEERGGVAVRTTSTSQAAKAEAEAAAEAAKKLAEAEAAARAASDAKVAGDGAAVAGTSAGAGSGTTATDGMQTHALPVGAGPTGNALDGSGAMGGQALGSQANLLKDPASLLSSRVITFDFDSTAIREEFRPLIEAHAVYLKDNKTAKAILQGHTDERGSREYNLALGQRRAESVQQALSLLGVDLQQLEAVSLGEEKPLAEGHDEAAWQQNRRAEIYYQGE